MTTLSEILKKKQAQVSLYRSDIVKVTASPLWKPVPGIPQSWRHTCKICGNILADDTQQFDLSDSVFEKYWKEHINLLHNS
jgi:hypothetical protein